jgi:hypothetical protein
MERTERMWQTNYLVNNFVGRHHGTLPMILIYSHDGDAKPAGVPKRTDQGGSLPDATSNPIVT